MFLETKAEMMRRMACRLTFFSEGFQVFTKRQFGCYFEHTKAFGKETKGAKTPRIVFSNLSKVGKIQPCEGRFSRPKFP